MTGHQSTTGLTQRDRPFIFTLSLDLQVSLTLRALDCRRKPTESHVDHANITKKA